MSTYLQTAIEDATAFDAPLAPLVIAAPAIEAYRSDPTGAQCALGPQPGAKALVRELQARFGGRGGIYNCRPVRGGTRLSLHGEGRAVDWYRNVKDPGEAAEAQRILDWLLAPDAQGNEHALARRMGVQEIIWNHRIWTARRHADGWREYKGVNPHTDHIHIGMTWPGARMETSHWTASAAAAPVAGASSNVVEGRITDIVVFDSGTSLTSWFQERTGKHFLDWFNATQSDRGAWEPLRRKDGKVARRFKTNTDADTKRRFELWWNGAPAAVFGKPDFTLRQFAALQSIFINEIGGGMVPLSEEYKKGSRGHPGLAYLFDHIPEAKKASYNAPAPGKNPLNMTAFDCFNDPDFIAAHGQRSLGSQLARTTDRAWAGRSYPAGVTTDPVAAGFVAEADFCKFRGRGMIQTTFRSGYRLIVKFIQSYTGSQPTVLDYRKRWAGMDPDKVLTRSSNDDWNDLFQKTDYVIALAGVRLHAASSKYLEISADRAVQMGTGRGSFHFMGQSISGSKAYGALFSRRCVQILDTLNGVPAAQSLDEAELSGPTSSAKLTWAGATPEQLEFKRQVYERQVANAVFVGSRFVKDVDDGLLGPIEGKHQARKPAATAMKQLLLELRQAHAAAVAAGDARASKIERIGIASSYRSMTEQFQSWNGKFRKYYAATQKARLKAPGGEHGEAAEKILAHHINGILAAPGFSRHNDGLAIDLRISDVGRGGKGLGPDTEQRVPWRDSWLWTWLTANAARHGYFQNKHINEPWHWEYKGVPAAAKAKGMAGSLAVAAAGEAQLDRVALLAAHEPGPVLMLRWNAIPDPAQGVDVVVHLHGYEDEVNLPIHKMPRSGLDFGPPPKPPIYTKAPPHPAWTGRTRPTLCILPRGRKVFGTMARQTFPALVKPGAFAALIDVALRSFEAQIKAPKRVPVNRIVLTAHSGGGEALGAVLQHAAGTPVDPHEVHVFDALYAAPTALNAWLRRRLGADLKALPAASADARAYLLAKGGGTRVLHLPDGRKNTTTKNSLIVWEAVKAMTPPSGPHSTLLRQFYYVEKSAVPHSFVAYWYGGRLLADVSAKIPAP